MKADTHPTYFPKATVACACGNKFSVGSTKEDLSVSICSACHPFYTGTERTVDTAGRIDRFKKRMEKTVKSRAK
jgi:large subunit ribosomal protein L31